MKLTSPLLGRASNKKSHFQTACPRIRLYWSLPLPSFHWCVTSSSPGPASTEDLIRNANLLYVLESIFDVTCVLSFRGSLRATGNCRLPRHCGLKPADGNLSNWKSAGRSCWFRGVSAWRLVCLSCYRCATEWAHQCNLSVPLTAMLGLTTWVRDRSRYAAQQNKVKLFQSKTFKTTSWSSYINIFHTQKWPTVEASLMVIACLVHDWFVAFADPLWPCIKVKVIDTSMSDI